MASVSGLPIHADPREDAPTTVGPMSEQLALAIRRSGQRLAASIPSVPSMVEDDGEQSRATLLLAGSHESGPRAGNRALLPRATPRATNTVVSAASPTFPAIAAPVHRPMLAPGDPASAARTVIAPARTRRAKLAIGFAVFAGTAASLTALAAALWYYA